MLVDQKDVIPLDLLIRSMQKEIDRSLINYMGNLEQEIKSGLAVNKQILQEVYLPVHIKLSGLQGKTSL